MNLRVGSNLKLHAVTFPSLPDMSIYVYKILRWYGRCTFLFFSLCLRSTQAQTIYDVLQSTPNLSSLAAAIQSTGLAQLLANPNAAFTLFAPTNSAFSSAFAGATIQCTTDYYSISPCTSLDQFINATDRERMLSNLIVPNTNFSFVQLTPGLRLQFSGDAVNAISVSGNGQKYLGTSPLLMGQFSANNGQIIAMTAYPPGNQGINSTSVLGCSAIQDFGPFNINQRIQMTSTSATGASQSDLSSLTTAYQRIRKVIDLPQGGITNPMSISYDPTSMYRLMRALPSKFSDSEAASNPPISVPSSGIITASGPASSPSSSIPITLYRSPSAVPQSATGSNNTIIVTAQTLSNSPNIPGVGESGVLGGPNLSNTEWMYPVPGNVTRPTSNDTLAYMTVLQLASLYKQKLVSSVELVQIYTDRLKKYDYVLEAVVTYTTDLAMKQAQVADQLLQNGTYLGPLHGIPYGLKDIMAVRGYPTTWGAPEFRNQYINADCNVYRRLTAAGAVLIAKLATGEMAYDDVWFNGKTKNPWNILEGSSGSSAGPIASTVAGTVPFSVGSETEGSLMSPASVCGASAMRPSLGSIGRSWTMTLADSLDKLGPVCRSAQDCAVIFDILRGKEDLDPASRDADLVDPFKIDISKMTVGYIANSPASQSEILTVLRSKGVTLKPFSLSYSLNSEDMIKVIMISEAAAHFDYWQRSGQDTQNVRQDYWPPLLRTARLIPAVEYIQVQRSRGILASQILSSMKSAGIDAFIANTTTELAACNLVGLPTVSVPIGFTPTTSNRQDLRRNPSTLGFFGWPNGEPEILALAMAWQNATNYHLQQPPIDNVPANILSQCLPSSRCRLPGNGTSPGPAPNIEISAQSADVG